MQQTVIHLGCFQKGHVKAVWIVHIMALVTEACVCATVNTLDYDANIGLVSQLQLVRYYRRIISRDFHICNYTVIMYG